MQGNVCHAGSHSGLLCAFIINGKYWLCLNLNYDFWSVIGKPIATFIHWPFLDKTLISRSGTCSFKSSEPRPQLATFMKTSCASVACYGEGLRALKLSLNATIFDTRVVDLVRLIAAHRKRRINTAPYKPGTWIGRRVQVGKCAVLYLESS